LTEDIVENVVKDFILLPQIVREDESRGKGLIQRHEVERSETAFIVEKKYSI